MEMALQKVTDDWNRLSGSDKIDYLANITTHSSDFSHPYKIGLGYVNICDVFCNQSMREKYPYSEDFWSVFSLIRRNTEYLSFRIQSKRGKIRTRKTPHPYTFHAVNTFINNTILKAKQIFQLTLYKICDNTVIHWPVSSHIRTES